ncbi:MAG TPA: hypothetical protein VL172_11440, partial [Kofleriaceae bacterium]|nr:hypothetical protein [Kofleriaceae bacterium]
LLGRMDEFEAGLEHHADLLRLDADSQGSMAWRPILRFLNRFKDQWRLGGDVLRDGDGRTGERIALIVALGPLWGSMVAKGPVTLDRCVGQLCVDLQSYDLAAPRAFALFRELRQTSDKQAVMKLGQEFRGLDDAHWMVPMRELWSDLFRRKLPWRSRLYAKLKY